MKPGDPKHNYVRALADMIDRGLIPKTTEVKDVTVIHVYGCGFFRRGRRNCNPTIILKAQMNGGAM